MPFGNRSVTWLPGDLFIRPIGVLASRTRTRTRTTTMYMCACSCGLLQNKDSVRSRYRRSYTDRRPGQLDAYETFLPGAGEGGEGHECGANHGALLHDGTRCHD